MKRITRVQRRKLYYDTDKCYECLFVTWKSRDRIFGETEFPGLKCSVKLRRGLKKASTWVYIGEFD